MLLSDLIDLLEVIYRSYGDLEVIFKENEFNVPIEVLDAIVDEDFVVLTDKLHHKSLTYDKEYLH